MSLHIIIPFKSRISEVNILVLLTI